MKQRVRPVPPAPPPSTQEVRVESRRSEQQCPLCWEPARVLGNVRCEACGARYHRECADELVGRCATLACPGDLPTSPPPRPYLERFQGPPRAERGRLRRAWRRRWLRARGQLLRLGAVWLAGLGLVGALAVWLGPTDFRVVLLGGVWQFAALVAGTRLLSDPSG